MKPCSPSTPEGRLVLLGSHIHITEPLKREITSLVVESLDWTKVVQTALAHNVTPILYNNLVHACADRVPADIFNAFQQHYTENHARNVYLAKEFAAISAALAQRGIPIIGFKGPLLAQQAYSSLALRRAGDIDILVQESAVDRVCDLLEKRGYCEEHVYRTGRALNEREQCLYRKYQSEYLFIRPHDMVMIEPHWRITPATLADNLDYDAIWRHAQAIPLADTKVLGLSSEDELLVLCLHGSKHEWTQLRWVCDIAALIESNPVLNWEVTHARAVAQGYARVLALGLSLCQRAFGLSLPVAVQRFVAQDNAAGKLADEVCGRLLDINNTTPDVFVLTRFRWQMRERLRDRLHYAAGIVITPRLKHIRGLRLPLPLSFLYYPYKLVHDYMLSPLLRITAPLRRGHEPLMTGARLLDPAQTSHALWTQRSGAWIRWADEIATPTDVISRHLLEAARIQPGQNVLDLASGPGEPALSIARQVGNAGLVVATDLVPEMLAGLKARAHNEGHTHVVVTAAEMSRLPFTDASFDVVTCRFGIMFAHELAGTLQEVRRVSRSGGHVAFATWGALEDNAVFRIMHAVIPSFIEIPPQTGDLNAFRFSSPGSLVTPMTSGGFVDLSEREITNVTEVPAYTEFWWPYIEMSFGELLTELTNDQRVALNRALVAAFAAYCEDGVYRLPVRIRIIAARNP